MMKEIDVVCLQLYYRVTSAPAVALISTMGAIRRALERGDADSSGSTLRVVGIVLVVLAVVALLGTTLYGVANHAVIQLGQR